MPVGTRRIPRTGRPNPVSPPVISSFANDPCGQRYAPLGVTIPALPALDQPAQPKHFPFPNAPIDDDEFIFEIWICFFTMMATCLQYVHLYRSVWWLPHSYTSKALNFYLIDPYLVVFIDLIVTRRLIYVTGCKVIETILPDQLLELTRFYLRKYSQFNNLIVYTLKPKEYTRVRRSLFFGIIIAVLAVCAFFVMKNHPMINILYLCYPVLVYLILFGFKVRPFFEKVNWDRVSTPPVHACSSNPVDIRKEVESLRRNFNNRMKQILFSAILNAYYAGFIPCCFTQPVLHYDTYWCTQHAIFVYLSGFISFSLHIISLRYCDILHRSALHLGAWERVETGRSMLLVSSSWKGDIFWPHGALVRHGREIWKAVGDCNSSEPGNLGQNRFYTLFKNPTNLMGAMLLVHLLSCLYQLWIICRTTLWYNMASLGFVTFFNYLLLYTLCRDYLVSYKIYFEERNMHKKINMR